MRWIDMLRLRLRSTFLGTRVDRELDEEMQYHLDRLIDEHVAAGMSRANARHAALREMGAIEQRKEDCRDERGLGAIDNLRRDVSYALRAHRKAPGVTVVALLSLALGIGANTAIFSLWQGVLHASLPGTTRPEELVMLTEPAETGSWNGRLDGERPWITYDEFEQLRDKADVFTSLTATQSSLRRYNARVDGGGEEEIQGRLVSGSFFETLGARPVIGRAFTADDDRQTEPKAVISYSYWQRRFGGSPDVLGRRLGIGSASLPIIGVAAQGFIGETVGQQPDFWMPLLIQPQVSRGNMLRDKPPEKSMWLHAIGRVKPGISLAQVDAQVSAIFRSGLETFYAGVPPERYPVVMNQQLRVRPASGGASGARAEFGASLNVLLAGVAVLLLIACANLANLFVARGAARRSEVALRLSLGASRARIVQQFVTESLVLGIAGGVAAVFVANVLHAALVAMMTQSDENFRMEFTLDPAALAFLIAVTIGATLVFGLLPAFQVTRTEPSAALKEQSRGSVGAFGWLRSSRAVVGLQLALSLPLIAGAGLLARTTYNLQHIAYGYSAEQLAVVRVDLRDVADQRRRHDLLDQLRDEILRIPGVRNVAYSQLGLFTGGESTSSIAVEGYVAKDASDSDSAVDVVGAGYFSTLGIPITLGREITADDASGRPRACVVNEAFVRKYFNGRNPIGMEVRRVAEESAQGSLRIVGVAGDARAQDLRDRIEPRFYVAAAQSSYDMTLPYFEVRTGRDTAAAIPSIRKAIARVDTALPVISARTFDEQIAPLTAQDRAIAELAMVFGLVALALVAIGLYGVLSYAVTRRTAEIAVRIALGAKASRVVLMIISEISGLVAAGLLIGAGLAYALLHMIGSLLYGVAPQDPATFAAATGLLVAVAAIAVVAPARRAARLDPMTALRQQ